MILADKLIELRKKNSMTQEELAERMNVSRQSVSKWEGAQSVPDLEKILKLSKLFGVSTDYLLKDEQESPEYITAQEDAAGLRPVSLEEASAFLETKERSAGPVALGVMLCILSPVCLLLLGGLSEAGMMSESLVGGIGITVLLVLVAAAVAIFLKWGMRTESWEFLEKEPIEPGYGVTGMARQRQRDLQSIYVRNLVIGVMLCILSPVPLFLVTILTEHDSAMLGCVCLLLGLVALGVGAIVRVCIPWGALQQLLQEGDYTPAKKRQSRRNAPIIAIYWSAVTAIYLGWSFAANAWSISWAVWPVAGVLFGLVCAVLELVQREK